jgi:hypothetical protein
MHSSILRRIWLSFMAQCLVFSAHTQLSHFFFPDSQLFRPDYHWRNLSSRNAHLVHQNCYRISFTSQRCYVDNLSSACKYFLGSLYSHVNLQTINLVFCVSFYQQMIALWKCAHKENLKTLTVQCYMILDAAEPRTHQYHTERVHAIAVCHQVCPSHLRYLNTILWKHHFFQWF